mmetsp:Transcript_34735/g.100650  ORF Transcript_34735/g.100650 Transcript_34735/m.100650 type:complete len:324 (-) Transcript_34735:115-1086(-)
MSPPKATPAVLPCGCAAAVAISSADCAGWLADGKRLALFIRARCSQAACSICETQPPTIGCTTGPAPPPIAKGCEAVGSIGGMPTLPEGCAAVGSVGAKPPWGQAPMGSVRPPGAQGSCRKASAGEPPGGGVEARIGLPGQGSAPAGPVATSCQIVEILVISATTCSTRSSMVPIRVLWDSQRPCKLRSCMSNRPSATATNLWKPSRISPMRCDNSRSTTRCARKSASLTCAAIRSSWARKSAMLPLEVVQLCEAAVCSSRNLFKWLCCSSNRSCNARTRTEASADLLLTSLSNLSKRSCSAWSKRSSRSMASRWMRTSASSA